MGAVLAAAWSRLKLGRYGQRTEAAPEKQYPSRRNVMGMGLFNSVRDLHPNPAINVGGEHLSHCPSWHDRPCSIAMFLNLDKSSSASLRE